MITKNIELKNKKILVTGAAGFIGGNLVLELLKQSENCLIIGIDCMSKYYDIGIKEYRLKEIEKLYSSHNNSRWKFIKGNICNKSLIFDLFEENRFDIVVNLAAQAGVRYSINNPDEYIYTNIVGFFNIIEACRQFPVEHLVYASSSSVYGSNNKIPYSIDDKTDKPVSLYAATKKSNELIAHAYSNLYNIPTTGLRFFTVYGPAGRPDMAYYKFTNSLVNGETIQVYNYGHCQRDFTYIEDIIIGIMNVIQCAPKIIKQNDNLPIPPYRIYNIGNSKPENLMTFVRILCEELVSENVLPKDFDIDKHIELVPMQLGDVPITYADTSSLIQDTGFTPKTELRIGLKKFVQWYKLYMQND